MLHKMQAGSIADLVRMAERVKLSRAGSSGP